MSLLRPDIYLDTIYDLNIDELIKKGYRTIFADIDNTIISWDSEEASKELLEFVATLESKGLELILLSNARNKRANHVASLLGVKGFGQARKPTGHGFYKALAITDSHKGEILMVGDQIFTDVLGAKLIGIKVALVKPLSTKELVSTKFMRKLERPFRESKNE